MTTAKVTCVEPARNRPRVYLFDGNEADLRGRMSQI